MPKPTKSSRRRYRKLLIVAGLALALYLFAFYNTRQLDAQSISFLTSVALDAQSDIYVPSNGCVRKFDAQGKFLGLWGPWQCINDGFNRFIIQNLAIDREGNFYVEIYNYQDNASQFQKLDKEGRVLFNFGNNGNGPGQFGNRSQVAQFAIDPANNIYITDYSNYGVQKFNSQGQFLAQIGSQGTGDGQFETVFNIAVDSQGNLFAGDITKRPNNQPPRLQKFDSQGNFVGLIGQDFLTAEYSKNAAQKNQISDLGLMSFDNEGNLNVVAGFWASFDDDFYLVKFSPTGQYLGKFSFSHSFPPRGLAVSQEKGVVYTAFSEAPRAADTIVLLDTKTNNQTVIISSSWTDYIFSALLMMVAALVGAGVIMTSLVFAFNNLLQKNRQKTLPPTPLNRNWPQ